MNKFSLAVVVSAVLLFATATTSFAQHTDSITYSTKINSHTHGGWPLQEYFGANKGDIIQLDVICDAWLDDNVFFGSPKLTGDDKAFTQTASELILCPKEMGWFKTGANCWHEHWQASSASTNDQNVWAQYLFLGTDAHYAVRLLSSEVQ